ncbi:MAG: glycoside hydrolase family 1 protein [Deltaproteobacteria bacterium]|nr:MAG: glycoside hydrolase family 1 protein [Deltaproteobacteria bacterium]
MNRWFLKMGVVGAMVASFWLSSVVGCGNKTDTSDGGTTETPAVANALQFPANFWWGVSIAGFQGDMGCPTLAPEKCEDRNSDWYQWATSPEIQSKTLKTEDGEYPFTGGDPISWGPGQWELYEKDFDMAKTQLGVRAFRLSIEWSRIFPKSTIGVEGHENLKKIANQEAIDTYRKMFKALRSRGMEPFVTLNHYTLPLWIHNGVECNKDLDKCTEKGWVAPNVLIPEIAKYSGFVAKEFGEDVDYWLTINEPFAVILPGYLMQVPDRINPPGVGTRFKEARTVMMGMIEAHAKMYDAVKANDTVDANKDGNNSLIGIPYSFSPVYPKDPKNKLDVKGAENVSYLLNGVFMEALNNGKLDEKLDGTTVDRPDLKRLDFIGMNYYEKAEVEGTETSMLPPLSTLFTVNPFTLKNIGFYPKGIYDLLMMVKKYNKPIIITENGHKMVVPPKAADGAKADDSRMSEFMMRHLFWIHKAIQDGADIRAYLYWSLVDNYEWNHGFNWRFGMFGYDPKDQTKKRVPRAAVPMYKKVIEANGLPLDDLKPLLDEEEKKLLEAK